MYLYVNTVAVYFWQDTFRVTKLTIAIAVAAPTYVLIAPKTVPHFVTLQPQIQSVLDIFVIDPKNIEYQLK